MDLRGSDLSMSDTLHPPLRIAVEGGESVSASAEKSHVGAFLEDYASRMATKGGDATMTTQLQKLKKALEKEQKK